MINFNDYSEKKLQVTLKSQELLFGKVGSIGGIEPLSNDSKPNAYHCWFRTFKNKEYLLEDNANDSNEISLNADEIEEIQVL